MLIGNFLFCSKLKNIISRSGNASFYLEKRASLPKQRLITMARNILKHSVFGAGGWCGSYHLLYCNGVSPIWDCMGKSPGSTTDTASSLMYTPGSSAGGSNSFILPPSWATWMDFLVLGFGLAWPIPGCCSHLGNKPVCGNLFSLCLFPSLSNNEEMRILKSLCLVWYKYYTHWNLDCLRDKMSQHNCIALLILWQYSWTYPSPNKYLRTGWVLYDIPN